MLSDRSGGRESVVFLRMTHELLNELYLPDVSGWMDVMLRKGDRAPEPTESGHGESDPLSYHGTTLASKHFAYRGKRSHSYPL